MRISLIGNQLLDIRLSINRYPELTFLWSILLNSRGELRNYDLTSKNSKYKRPATRN